MSLPSPLLRVRQLTRSFRVQDFSQAETALIQSILLAQQFVLFQALPLHEQRHALNVCQTLLKGGYGQDVELLQASLLHDLGKHDPATGRTVPRWVKVANVALRTTFGPASLLRLARRDQPDSWRYLFWLQLSHEKRGARLARNAGSSRRVVALVGGCRTLQRRGDDAAKALKWADDLN